MKIQTMVMAWCMAILVSAVTLASAEIKVYPIPWVPAAGEAHKIKTGNPDEGITFSGLPTEGNIYIYTVTGTLVRHLPFSAPVDGKLQLFGNSDAGKEYIASGVYIWRVTSPAGAKTGKLIVVR